MEDEAGQSRVLVEILQLAGRVAVVDVDRHGTDLEACEHSLDVLGAVGQLQADPIAGADAGTSEVVGKAVGALVQLGVTEPASARHHRRLGPRVVNRALEEIGKIELHGPPRYLMGLTTLHFT